MSPTNQQVHLSAYVRVCERGGLNTGQEQDRRRARVNYLIYFLIVSNLRK